MEAHTASTGSAVAFIETPSPAMMFVACPVVEAAATCRTMSGVMISPGLKTERISASTASMAAASNGSSGTAPGSVVPGSVVPGSVGPGGIGGTDGGADAAPPCSLIGPAANGVAFGVKAGRGAGGAV